MKLSYLALLFFFQSASAVLPVSDLTNLEKARTSFEKGRFEEALKTYALIPKESDYWAIALEEKSWSFFRLDQYDKSLAGVTTLTSPALSGIVGTEPFLLKALIQLRTCDYKAIFKTLEDYKKIKRDQVMQMQTLAKTGSSPGFEKALAEWIKEPKKWESAGENVAFMPRLFHRDLKIQALMRQNDLQGVRTRIQQLADVESKDNARILQKLQLVEVEAIQGLHLLGPDSGTQGSLEKKSDYDLVFNDNGKEVWLDELDKVQTQVKRCKALKGRTML